MTLKQTGILTIVLLAFSSLGFADTAPKNAPREPERVSHLIMFKKGSDFKACVRGVQRVLKRHEPGEKLEVVVEKFRLVRAKIGVATARELANHSCVYHVRPERVLEAQPRVGRGNRDSGGN